MAGPSAYLKSTSAPAHQLLPTQQLAEKDQRGRGAAPPHGSWSWRGVTSPLLPSWAVPAGQGGKSQAQLMGLQIQSMISAPSVARQDITKTHFRQLLRTLLFCLCHPEHAACLPPALLCSPISSQLFCCSLNVPSKSQPSLWHFCWVS